MSNGHNVRFGVQVVQQLVLGAAKTVGALTPFVIAGVVVKRKFRSSIKKTAEFVGDSFERAVNKTIDGIVDTEEGAKDVPNPVQEEGLVPEIWRLKNSGMSDAEIGEKLDITEDSIKNLIRMTDDTSARMERVKAAIKEEAKRVDYVKLAGEDVDYTKSDGMKQA